MTEDLKMRSIYLVFISMVFLLAGCQEEDQISMVRITYPYDGAVFFKGEKVRIAVDASAEMANVKEVHFSVDGKSFTLTKKHPMNTSGIPGPRMWGQRISESGS